VACRQEADSQAASLRSQAAAREERLAAQHASRVAALQSELDARGAAACDSDSALAAARGEITRLTQQVRRQDCKWLASSISYHRACQREGMGAGLICCAASAKAEQ
jgi:hypothetical protein